MQGVVVVVADAFLPSVNVARIGLRHRRRRYDQPGIPGGHVQGVGGQIDGISSRKFAGPSRQLWVSWKRIASPQRGVKHKARDSPIVCSPLAIATTPMFVYVDVVVVDDVVVDDVVDVVVVVDHDDDVVLVISATACRMVALLLAPRL